MTEQTLSAIKVTFDEYLERFAGKRYEYVGGYAVPLGAEVVNPDGEVTVAPTKFGHGKVAGRLHTLLGAYVLEHNLGEVLSAETGFMVSQDPPEMRAADIAFITRERADEIENDAEWLSAPPDLAVEVISEYDRAADIRSKAESYLKNGTRLLWIVYPKNRVIDVYRPNHPMRTLTVDDMLDGGDVVPGFSTPLKTIFAE